MWHRSETVYDLAGNAIVYHYQKDLAGNWVSVGTITTSPHIGAEAFKKGIIENKKRKRTN